MLRNKKRSFFLIRFGRHKNATVLMKHKNVRELHVTKYNLFVLGQLSSLRSYNEDAKSVSAGKDCGMIVDASEVPQEGDRIQCCDVEMVNDVLNWNPPGF